VEVLNPISENYKYFQASLIPNLLKSIHLNQFYFKEIKIFEISKVAHLEEEKINEEYHLGIGFAFKDPEEILKELAGVLRILKEELRINFNLKEVGQNQAEIFFNEEKIGIFALIPKKILGDYDLDLEVGVMEINIRKLRKFQKLIKEFEIWPVFPSIVRDLSFFVDEKIKFNEIEKEIKKQKINFFKEIKLIDIYYAGKKSMTLRFIFNHPQRSLKDEEVNLAMRKVEEFLKEKYKIILR
jgi:phenylalanyl-tRNA synthetase beta chain